MIIITKEMNNIKALTAREIVKNVYLGRETNTKIIRYGKINKFLAYELLQNTGQYISNELFNLRVVEHRLEGDSQVFEVEDCLNLERVPLKRIEEYISELKESLKTKVSTFKIGDKIRFCETLKVIKEEGKFFTLENTNYFSRISNLEKTLVFDNSKLIDKKTLIETNEKITNLNTGDFIKYCKDVVIVGDDVSHFEFKGDDGIRRKYHKSLLEEDATLIK